TQPWVDDYGHALLLIDHGRIKDDGEQIDDAIFQQNEFFGPRADWKFLLATSGELPFGSRSLVPDDQPRQRKYSYDPLGRLIQVEGFLTGTLPLDRHHEEGKPTAAPPPAASKDHTWVELAGYAYDGLDNTVKLTGPNGRCRQIEYDRDFGQLPERI